MRAHKERVEALMRAELERLGKPDPARGASELALLIDGALAAGANRPGSGAGRAARALAEQVIDG